MPAETIQRLSLGAGPVLMRSAPPLVIDQPASVPNGSTKRVDNGLLGLSTIGILPG